MKRALIRPEFCMNCEQCNVIENCPMHAAFREAAEDRPWVDFYRCSGCQKCKVFCRHKAIEEIYHPCDGQQRMGW